MHTALRPYMTAGIALVGASVIAVAPVTVPPPWLPSVDVVAADVVPSVSADVQLTGLADVLAVFPQLAATVVQIVLEALPLPAKFESLVMALANAGVPAVTETVKLFTETIPTAALNLIAAGKFAHLPVLAIQSVFLGVITPPAQYLSVLVEHLPLPFGTPDGLIDEAYLLFVKTPMVAGLTIMNLVADVFDSGLSLAAAFTGTIDALSTAFAAAVESVGKIVAAVVGALPFAAIEQQAPDAARAMEPTADLPAANDTSVVATVVDPSQQEYVAPTVTVAVDPSTVISTEEVPTTPVAAEVDEELSEAAVVTDGTTDLAADDTVEPGDLVGEPGEDGDDAAAPTVPDDTSAAEDAPAEETESPTETSTDGDEGSVDSSADDDTSPGEPQ